MISVTTVLEAPYTVWSSGRGAGQPFVVSATIAYPEQMFVYPFVICLTFLGRNCKMSRIVRKPDFCLGENKGTDQLRGNRVEAQIMLKKST